MSEHALLEWIAQKRQLAERVEKELAEAAPLIIKAAGHLLACETLDVAQKPDEDRRKLIDLFTLLIRLQNQALAERKADLLASSAQSEDENSISAKRSQGLSAETLRQIEEMANLL
jgi:hypothetical protein